MVYNIAESELIWNNEPRTREYQMMNIYYHITESRHGDLDQCERFIVMPFTPNRRMSIKRSSAAETITLLLRVSNQCCFTSEHQNYWRHHCSILYMSLNIQEAKLYAPYVGEKIIDWKCVRNLSNTRAWLAHPHMFKFFYINYLITFLNI